MKTIRFDSYWVDSARQILDKGDLRDYWIGISYLEDFLGTTPSYTAIQDPILRLCHRLIACSIARRSQAPEKVTVTYLFYLRGWTLARSMSLIYWLEILGGLTVIAPELLIIDMGELVRLEIYEKLDDTWAWVAIGLEKQPDTTADALEATEDAPTDDQGSQADPAHVQAPMDFLRFTIWVIGRIPQLLDSVRISYTPYSETRIPYQRTKPSSKFSTIAREYFSKTSIISKQE
nr:hypothetical protein [Tanacetum cinerariifolium]